jgi:hypothetical protein
MRFILVSTVLLAQAFTALSQRHAQLRYHVDTSCEELTRDAGRATSLWAQTIFYKRMTLT